MLKEFLEDIKEKNIAILAFQKEGKSTLKYIRKYLKDKKITILDKNEKLVDDEIIKNDKNLDYVFGSDYLKDIDKFDLIIKSPGVSLSPNILSKLNGKIKTETDIALDYLSKNIIGITGSKGKSTTTSLIYKILKDQNIDCYLCGNIGIPIFDVVDNVKNSTYLVVEMSAYQTEFLRKSPYISILLNLYEEHLDYFHTKDKYFNSKLNIARFQDEDDYFICLKNETIDNLLKDVKLKSHVYKVLDKDNKNSSYIDGDNIIIDNEKVCKTDIERKIIGEHNLYNIMFALTISKILSLDISKVLKSIKEFTPLEHRLEYIGTYNNIIFYNDSISTIPEALMNAVKTLKNVDTLIFGGYDRGIDYESLIKFLNESYINNFICLPTTAHRLGKELENKNVFFVDNMEDAVNESFNCTENGKICLLSPAAASYNMYKNFEERGKDFKNKVKSYKKINN